VDLSSGTPFPAGPAQPGADATRKLLDTLWERNLPLLLERLALLQSAVDSATCGDLQPDLRAEAIDIAHKLTGSLGMFGYIEATVFVRSLEHQLEDAGPLDPAQLAKDLAALHTALSI